MSRRVMSKSQPTGSKNVCANVSVIKTEKINSLANRGVFINCEEGVILVNTSSAKASQNDLGFYD